MQELPPHARAFDQSARHLITAENVENVEKLHIGGLYINMI